MRVLVSDDSHAIRLRVADHVRAVAPHAEIHEAADGRTAVETALRARPDVVFLDLVMPYDANEVRHVITTSYEERPYEGDLHGGARALREILDAEPNLRIVVITGLAPNDPTVREVLSLGAERVLHKPLDLKGIAAALDAL